VGLKASGSRLRARAKCAPRPRRRPLRSAINPGNARPRRRALRWPAGQLGFRLSKRQSSKSATPFSRRASRSFGSYSSALSPPRGRPGPAQIVERHRLQEMELLDQRAVAALLGAGQRTLHVLQGQLEIVARPEPAHVEVGAGAQHLGSSGSIASARAKAVRASSTWPSSASAAPRKWWAATLLPSVRVASRAHSRASS